MDNKQTIVTTIIYRLVNQCDPTTVPMGAIYAELSDMLKHGFSSARVDRIMAMAKLDDLE